METKTTKRRWTEEEDDRLFRQVKQFPQNLHKCFKIVAEVTGRTPNAVAYRWYTHVSKNPKYICFFMVSQKNVNKNRKNCGGALLKYPLWRKILKLLHL